MAKFKLGDLEIEGDDIEIGKILKDNNVEISKFLNTSVLEKNVVKPLWVILPVVIYSILCILIYTKIPSSTLWRSVEVISVFILLLVLVCVLHVKLNNPFVSVTCLVCGSIIIAISLGSLTPENAAQKIQELSPKITTGNEK